MLLLGYCRRAPKIKGEGKIVGDEQIVFKKGEVVKVECDEGYTASNGVTESTCDGKKFSPRKIKCKKNKEGNYNYCFYIFLSGFYYFQIE